MEVTNGARERTNATTKVTKVTKTGISGWLFVIFVNFVGVLDRYAARCANFVLVVTRIAVLGARSAPRNAGNQSRALPGYQGQSPWLVRARTPVVRWSRGLVAAVVVFLTALAVRPFAQGGRATFPAQQRAPGDPALIARGNGLYGVYCRACHGADLRGGDQGGPNLLRSPVVLNDQAGELLLPIVRNGQRGAGVMPPIPMMPDDVRAVAEYIHSVAATMRGQGSPPPGAAPVLNVLVGDAAKGQAYFAAKCGSCHSVSGDLQGIASRLPDPIALQNYWLSAGGGLGRGGRGGPGAAGAPRRDVTVTVTPASGAKVEGALVRLDDFYLVLRLADGTERSFARSDKGPRIETRAPYEPHRKLLPTYRDSDIHDVTAYLATLK